MSQANGFISTITILSYCLCILDHHWLGHMAEYKAVTCQKEKVPYAMYTVHCNHETHFVAGTKSHSHDMHVQCKTLNLSGLNLCIKNRGKNEQDFQSSNSVPPCLAIKKVCFIAHHKAVSVSFY